MNEKEKAEHDALLKKMEMLKSSPDIMSQAMGLTNMAYAFQFAQTANVYCRRISNDDLTESLTKIHTNKGLLISVAPFANEGFMVTWYAKENCLG